MEALSSAVTGIGSFQKALDVVGSNLANVATPGYKASTITFQELIASVSRGASGPSGGIGGINPQQSVQGVRVGTQNARYTQGAVSPTGKTTDLAIIGDGFFVVGQQTGQLAYTRNGNFTLDKNGSLVNVSGFPVMGWKASALGVVDTAQPVEALAVNVGQSRTSVTQNVAYAGVLDGSKPPPGTGTATLTAGSLDAAAAVGTIANGTSTNWVDDNGTGHAMSYQFTKVTDNAGLDDTWNVTINGFGASGSWTGGAANATNIPIVFDAAGNIASVNGVAGSTLAVSIPDSVGGTQPVTVDFSAVTNSVAPVAVTGGSDGTSGSPLQNTARGQVYDSLGTAHELSVSYKKVVPNIAGVAAQWNYTVTVDGALSPSTGTLCFTNTGDLDTFNSTANPHLTAIMPNGAAPLDIAADFTALKNQAVTELTAVVQKSQDGTPPGTLLGISVQADGSINGSFSNGLEQIVGKVALATFPNVHGLVTKGGGLMVTTAASGEPTYGTGGTITSGALESSNVDIGAEFTNMIIAQRAFQANSKMVSVIDQVLAEIANLKS